MRGFSFVLSFGKPCWPQVEFESDPFMLRFVLGPVALMIIAIDMDCFFGYALDKLEERREDVRNKH